MENKKKYIIIGVTFLLLILILTGLYYFSLEEEPVAEEDFAELTLYWLNDQKNDEGVYRVNYSCLAEEDEHVQHSTRIFPSILWGKLKYYENNLDYEGILKLEKELDLAINAPTQHNQWNCKLLEDFWKSDILSEEQKEKAKFYCRNTGGEAFIDSEMHDVAAIDAEELEGFILQNIDNIINHYPLDFDKFYDVDSLRDEFRKITAYVSNDSARYLLEKEENEENEEIMDIFKRGALNTYYLALQAYPVVDETIENNALMGIASLDLYRITNEQRYLDITLYLFKENKELELLDINHNYDYVYFGLFAENLFRVTGNETYAKERERIKDKIIENQFIYSICEDFEVTDGIALDYENGGFRSGVGSFYLIKENVLMLGLLSI